MIKIKKVIIYIITIFLFTSLLSMNSVMSYNYNEIPIITEKDYIPVDKNADITMIDPQKKTVNLSNRSSNPYWKEENGEKYFYDGNNNLVHNGPSKKIIDVSKWQEKIDWEKVKNSGIDGAIIRLGYGSSTEDQYFKRNISECNRLNIPYGVYLYSYAYDANFAFAEAENTFRILSEVDLNLSYPIYYDLEAFNPWQDGNILREPPKNTSQYESIVATYINRLEELGYKNQVHVYSYRSYLQNQLNSPYILQYATWIAAYTKTLNFNNKYYSGDYGWQYTSSEHVNGISGNVDMSSFSNIILKPIPTKVEIGYDRKDINTGSSYQFSASVFPENASQAVSWRTGNSKVATVDSNGKVTGISAGSTWLYATTSTGVEDKCLILVKDILADNITLDYLTRYITLGFSAKFNATITPSNTTNKNISWRTGNSKVATVDSTGRVTTTGVGNTWLYAMTSNGKEAKCLIKVLPRPTQVEIGYDRKDINTGSSYQFSASVFPENASQAVSWRTGNSKVATVDSNGKVTGISAGSTWLYATTSTGVEDKCLILIK